MSFGPGKNGVFKLDDGSGSLRDISAYLTSVQEAFTQGTYESTVLGLSSKTYIPGLGDGTIQVEGNFDPTVDGYLFGVDAASRSFEYYPFGTPVGATKPEYNGECIKTSYQVNDPVDGIVPFSLSLQVTGTVTRTAA